MIPKGLFFYRSKDMIEIYEYKGWYHFIKHPRSVYAIYSSKTSYGNIDCPIWGPDWFTSPRFLEGTKIAEINDIKEAKATIRDALPERFL